MRQTIFKSVGSCCWHFRTHWTSPFNSDPLGLALQTLENQIAFVMNRPSPAAHLGPILCPFGIPVSTHRAPAPTSPVPGPTSPVYRPLRFKACCYDYRWPEGPTHYRLRPAHGSVSTCKPFTGGCSRTCKPPILVTRFLVRMPMRASATPIQKTQGVSLR